MSVTKYQEWMPSVAMALYRMGADDDVVAEALGIATRTVINYRAKFPEFAAACRESKAVADSRVVNALYSKAIGIRAKVVRMNRRDEAIEVDVFEAPDLGSIALWLCNRDPEHWRSVNRTEHTGAGGGPIEVNDARQKLEDQVAAVLAEAERATQS
jgi:hypothetical protein